MVVYSFWVEPGLGTNELCNTMRKFPHYSASTLFDTETTTDTDTDKLAQNPVVICISVSVQYEHFHTIQNNPFFLPV